MRLPLKSTTTLALLGCWIGLGVHCTMAQKHPSPSILLRQLQSPQSSARAEGKLLKVGKSDPAVRQYLATHLPGLIKAGPSSCPPNIQDLDGSWHTCPWYNAVELAGKLKIGEAASGLGPWIAVRTSPIVIGLSSEVGLVPYPVATALWEIGNPSVPVVQHILESNQGKDLRFVDERVLCIINTPESKAVLRDYLPRESDPNLRAMIKKNLEEK